MISGDCGATYPCITSPNYTENYAPEGSCVIKLASLTLDVKDFETEVLWETMVVNSQNYSGSPGPSGISRATQVCWSVVTSDYTEVRINGRWLGSHDVVVHSGSLQGNHLAHVLIASRNCTPILTDWLVDVAANYMPPC